eukprot:gene24932-31330_t
MNNCHDTIVVISAANCAPLLPPDLSLLINQGDVNQGDVNANRPTLDPPSPALSLDQFEQNLANLSSGPLPDSIDLKADGLKHTLAVPSRRPTFRPSTAPSLSATIAPTSSWTNASNIQHWNSLESSTSGQYVYASFSSSKLYASQDFGRTWTLSSTVCSGCQTSAAYCSGDGKYVLALVYGSQYAYLSSDYAATFIQLSSTSNSIYWSQAALNGTYSAGVVCSSSGQVVVLLDQSGSKMSRNYGASFASIGASAQSASW